MRNATLTKDEAARTAYQHHRNQLKTRDFQQRSDYKIRETLSEKEKTASKRLAAVRGNDLAAFLERFNGMHPAQTHICNLRSFLNGNKTNLNSWQLIREMPKAAILHAHFDSLVDCRWLVQHATYQPNCFMKTVSGGGILFEFSLKRPEDQGWELVDTLRSRFPGGASAFDDYLFNEMTLKRQIEADVNQLSDHAIWQAFIGTFSAVAGLITYLPVFEKYMQKKMEQLVGDGIMYIEERMVGLATILYDLERKYPIDFTIEKYMASVDEFKATKKGCDFVGARIIYCGVKGMSAAMVRRDFEDVLRLKKNYPQTIAGFDLVGHEDGGYSFSEYLDLIIEYQAIFKQEQVDIPFVWHAGETVNIGTEADENLFDAILTGSKRIGHGLSLMKHPHLQEEVRQRHIAIELCPVSNQILKYTPVDLRLHPFISFLNNGLPVILSPDDPAIFCVADHLSSYDFWLVLMSWSSVDLATLKYVLLNSIEFSLVESESQRDQLNQVFSRQWDAWLNRVLEITGGPS